MKLSDEKSANAFARRSVKRVGKRAKRSICVAALAGVLAIPSPASAAFTCHAYPAAMLGVDGLGTLVVNVEGIPGVKICSMSTDAYGISKDACTAWYSALLTWREMNKTAVLSFDPNNVGGATSCAQLQAWMPAGPYHLEAG